MAQTPTARIHHEATQPLESEARVAPEIAPIDSLAGFYAVEHLQKQVWGDSDRVVVPTTLLYSIVASGGILLGAHVDDELVGFVLGLMAQKDRVPYHASHMLGIHPEFQTRGLGAALKFRQREVALAQGLHTMTWTFDPLEARNAYFNLHKLGARARVYGENHYGELTDDLNGGLPSDRLLVEWALDRSLLAGVRAGPEKTVTILRDVDDVAHLDLAVSPDHDAIRIEVPVDVQHLKHADPASAMIWRLAVREAFGWALKHGYVGSDFIDGGYILTPDRFARKERLDAR